MAQLMRTLPVALALFALTAGRPAMAQDDEDAPNTNDRHLRLFYAEASVGMTWLKMLQVQTDENFVVAPEAVDSTGFGVGAGAGLFVSFITLGLQTEIATHDNFNLGTLAIDVGFEVPAEHVDPYLRLGLGYAWMFNIDASLAGDATNPASAGIEDATIRGLVFDLGAGIDVRVNELVAVGLGADVAGFNLRRNGQTGLGTINDLNLAEDGDALGVQISALAQCQLHF